MKVYAISNYFKHFADELVGTLSSATIGSAVISRYPNGELHTVVHDDVQDEECWVIGSIAPPDSQLLATILLANALQRGGAQTVQAFMPYLGYARQDKMLPHENGGIALLGSILKDAGVDGITTIDVHSNLDKQLLDLPLRSLSPASLFAPYVHKLDWDDYTVVAPDEGAIARARALANAVHNTHAIAYMIKKRVDGIVHRELVGELRERIILVDDILDSGHTLVSASQLLQDKGVKEIVAIVTHGVFTGTSWRQLFSQGVKALYVTDSCPEAAQLKYPGIHLVPLDPLLKAIRPELTGKETAYENATT